MKYTCPKRENTFLETSRSYPQDPMCLSLEQYKMHQIILISLNLSFFNYYVQHISRYIYYFCLVSHTLMSMEYILFSHIIAQINQTEFSGFHCLHAVVFENGGLEFKKEVGARYTI